LLSRPVRPGATAAIAAAIGIVVAARLLRRWQHRCSQRYVPSEAGSQPAIPSPIPEDEAVTTVLTRHPADDLTTLACDIRVQLRERQPRRLDGLPAGTHELGPCVAKPVWEKLGAAIRVRERLVVPELNGEKWISLRLDGCGFSKQTRLLRRAGVLEAGFSSAFGDIMQDCMRAVMEPFGACLGYTQSDEMTVLVRSTRVIRGKRQPHYYGGRAQKWCSVAASTATALFNRRLEQLAADLGKPFDRDAPLVHFDCRIGAFDSEEEALALVLWRAQDCGVNGISDAVYHSETSGKNMKGAHTGQKLQWLESQGKLPLHPHQAYGTLLIRGLRRVQGLNPVTGKHTEALRRVVRPANGGEGGRSRCVLNLAAQDMLSLSEDEIAERSDEPVNLCS